MIHARFPQKFDALRRVAMVVWALGVMLPVLPAQNVNATLTGTVLDAAGAAVSGASVKVSNEGRQLLREIATDESGQFRVSGLPPGLYRLEAAREGFATYQRESVQLRAGDSTHLTVQFEVAGTTQSVTVTDRISEIERSRNSSSRGATLEQQELTDLPTASGGVSRNYRTQVYLVPGAAPARVAHSPFSFNGLRAQSTVNVMVDGADFNNPTSGSVLGTGFTEQPVSQEALSAVEVQSNNYRAENGRAAGGTINLVTQSSSNRWHGKFWEFLRNDALDARNTLLPVKNTLRRNQFGGSLGGALWKDRLFVYANAEWLLDRTRGFSSPRATFSQEERNRAAASVRPLLELYPLPNVPGTVLYNSGSVRNRDTGRYLLGKVDYLAAANHLVGFRYSKAEQLTASTAREFAQGLRYTNNNKSYLLSATSTLKPTVVNEARVYYTGRNATTAPIQRYLGDRAVNDDVGLLNIVGAERAGSFFRDYSMMHNYQFSNDLSVQRGRHGLKFGVVGRRIQQNTTGNQLVDGQLTFDSRENFLAGRPSVYTKVQGDTRLDQRQTEVALYGQTDFRVRPNLNFNLGLRWELYTPPGDKFGRVEANYATDRNNIAPRLGFSYSPGTQTRLVVRGGYGLFYTPLPMRFLGNLRFTPPRVQQFSVLAPAFPNLLVGSRVPRSDVTVTDPAIIQPYAQQYNLTVDLRVPGSEAVVSVGYVGTRASHLGMTNLPNGGDRLAASLRPDPSRGVVTQLQTNGSSNYHSLQTSVGGRLRYGLSVRSAYTYSKAIDDISLDTAQFISYTNRRLDRAAADFDVRHNLTNSVLWALPVDGMLRPGLRNWLGGWQLSSILTMRSAFPFSLLSGTDTPDGVRINRINDVAGTLQRGASGFLAVSPAGGLTLTELRSRVTPAAGTVGTLGRNTERGDGFYDVSLGVHKNFVLTETLRLQLRVETFNTLNTANYETYVGSLADPRFGQAATAAQGRTIQLGARITF
jgi:hypothetical protein